MTGRTVTVHLKITAKRTDGPPASMDAIVQAIDEYLDGQSLEVDDPERDQVSLYDIDVKQAEWTA